MNDGSLLFREKPKMHFRVRVAPLKKKSPHVDDGDVIDAIDPCLITFRRVSYQSLSAVPSDTLDFKNIIYPKSFYIRDKSLQIDVIINPCTF